MGRLFFSQPEYLMNVSTHGHHGRQDSHWLDFEKQNTAAATMASLPAKNLPWRPCILTTQECKEGTGTFIYFILFLRWPLPTQIKKFTFLDLWLFQLTNTDLISSNSLEIFVKFNLKVSSQCNLQYFPSGLNCLPFCEEFKELSLHPKSFESQ